MAAISYVVIGPCNTSTLHTAYRNANVDQMPDGLCERCLLYLNCMRLRLADMGHVMRPGRQEPVAGADISSNRTKTRGLPLAMSVTIRPARVRVLHLVSRGTRIMTWVCNRQTTLRPCRPVTYRTFQRTIPCAIVSVSSCFIPFAFPTALPDLYHAMTWPSLSYVAEDAKGRIVGYVLAKMWVRQISAFSSHN